jgi:hypothetical protein
LFYSKMFAAAGFPGSIETGWTDEMIDSVVISGDEVAVADRVEEVFGWGASELLVTVIRAGEDMEASEARTLKLLAQLSGRTKID